MAPTVTLSKLSTFELALVGAGRMGQTHLRALAGNRSVTIRQVVEPVPAVRERLAGNGQLVYPTVDDLFSRATPDGVLVAVPTDQHLTIVRAAVEAGVPVLCEKPAGRSSTEVLAAGEYAAARGVAFQVAYWRRYVPALQQLRDRIQSGALGDVHLLAGWQWDGQPPAARFRATSGGIFVDMGVHEFDQLRWLTGQEVLSVSAVAAELVSDPAVERDVDSAQALLSLSGGGVGTVSLGRHYPGGDMATAEVFGTRGHERVTFLDPAEADASLFAALRRQAEAFAELVRTGRGTGAGVGDAVAALDTAARATREIGL